jgi:predicted negative regulator of RcsB-dependent stress response
MQAQIIDFASVKIQRASAVAAARAASDAAELATMLAVKKMVDKIAADKASGHLSTSVQYRKAFAHLFN